MSEVKTLTPEQNFKLTIQRMAPEFAKALPAHVKKETFMSAIHTASINNPKIIEADIKSLFVAAMEAARLGVMPDGKLAFINAYGRKCAFQLMTAGMKMLIMNSGLVSRLWEQVIFEKDEFDYYADQDGLKWKYRPFRGEGKGEPIGAISVAQLTAGGTSMVYMDKAEIMVIKAGSQSKKIWDGVHGLRMWEKTAFRRHFKSLPKSSDVNMEIYSGDIDETPVIVDVESSAPKAAAPIKKAEGPSRLNTLMEDKPAAKEVEVIEQAPMPEAPVQNFAPASTAEVPI